MFSLSKIYMKNYFIYIIKNINIKIKEVKCYSFNINKGFYLKT